jgi:hypothetical protein
VNIRVRDKSAMEKLALLKEHWITNCLPDT